MRNFANYDFFSKQVLNGEIKLKTPEETGWINGINEELDIRSIDCSRMDLSKYQPSVITFDDKTIFPVGGNKMPTNFSPREIMKKHKNPGLNVRKLHEKGLSGKGLCMAIIDQPLADHREYHDNIVHYEEIGCENYGRHGGSMHGSAVASIAVGKSCGVAPEANLYYFAAEIKCGAGGILTSEHYSSALNRILDINDMLPDNEKIHVVSVSWGGMQDTGTLMPERWVSALERAKNAGVFVTTCAIRKEYGLHEVGLGRDISLDPDDVKSYGGQSWKDNNNDLELQKRTLAFPMDHRTTACPQGYDNYVHYFHGGYSWLKPFEAALFLLARQASPDITPEQFWEKGLKTGSFNQEAKSVIVNPVALFD